MEANAEATHCYCYCGCVIQCYTSVINLDNRPPSPPFRANSYGLHQIKGIVHSGAFIPSLIPTAVFPSPHLQI